MTPSPDLNSSIAVENGVPLDVEPPLEQSAPTKQPQNRPWYRRPRVLYAIVAIIMLISIALAAVAVLLATGYIGNIGNKSDVQATAGTGSDNQDTAPTEPAPVDADSPTPPPQAEVPATEPSAPSDQDDATEPTAQTQTSPPTALPTALATDASRTDPLAFYVMGDVPYAQWEEIMLGTQMGQMTVNLYPGAEFVVHVGDMQKAQRTNCALGHFFKVANILLQGPLPTFVQVGDNDYLDCPDKDAAWSNYITTFVGFEGNWTHSLDVERWTEPMNVPVETDVTRQVAKPEMFAFVEDGILFLSFTLLNMNLDEGELPDDLFYERLADSKAWVTKQLSEKQPFRGVVMFSHAMGSRDIRPFFVDLREVFYDAGAFVPVLYIHGDGHDFKINTNFGNNIAWPQLTRIEVDQGAYADPLVISVAPFVDGFWQPLTADDSGLQFAVGSGLFLVDRQNGRYPDSVNPNKN